MSTDSIPVTVKVQGEKSPQPTPLQRAVGVVDEIMHNGARFALGAFLFLLFVIASYYVGNPGVAQHPRSVLSRWRVRRR
jgi:hypothetical protein